MFRVVTPPIIRSAYNCIYSIWYLSHRYCYLSLSWKSWNWFECALAHSNQFQLESLLASCQHNLNDIYLLLCIQCWTPDVGQRNCPKHVEFYSKNKSEKLVRLVGFIIRIYHDARSSECQIRQCQTSKGNILIEEHQTK
jgi:hypothetical protein